MKTKKILNALVFPVWIALMMVCVHFWGGEYRYHYLLILCISAAAMMAAKGLALERQNAIEGVLHSYAKAVLSFLNITSSEKSLSRADQALLDLGRLFLLESTKEILKTTKEDKKNEYSTNN